MVAAPSVLSHAGLSQLLLSVSWASAASPSNRKRLGRTSSSQGINAIACGSHWLTQTPGLPETLACGHRSGPCGSAPERHLLGFSFTLKLESSGLHFQLHKTENDALVRPAPSPLSLCSPAFPQEPCFPRVPSTCSQPILKSLIRGPRYGPSHGDVSSRCRCRYQKAYCHIAHNPKGCPQSFLDEWLLGRVTHPLRTSSTLFVLCRLQISSLIIRTLR